MISSSTFLLVLAALSTSVQFDVQTIAPAIALNSDSASRQMPDSRLVQVRLDVSTIVPSEFQGNFEEAMIKFATRQPAVQVADYWPRTEMYSPVTTPISVAEDYDRTRQASIQGAGGYPFIGSAQGQAYFHDNLSRDVQYQQRPPMQLLSAAGTIDRRSGVYFKLRSTPQSVLEGSRTFVLTLEVPSMWRGDVLEFHAVAYGRKTSESNNHRKTLGQERFLIAVYADGDKTAAEYAMSFVQQQSKLRRTARQFAENIEKRAYPTPVHKLGKALDIYAPQVPTDYLEQWIFGAATNQPNSRLPVDLRVAMLDFIDSRRVIESLAAPTTNLASHTFATR